MAGQIHVCSLSCATVIKVYIPRIGSWRESSSGGWSHRALLLLLWISAMVWHQERLRSGWANATRSTNLGREPMKSINLVISTTVLTDGQIHSLSVLYSRWRWFLSLSLTRYKSTVSFKSRLTHYISATIYLFSLFFEYLLSFLFGHDLSQTGTSRSRSEWYSQEKV